VEAYRSPRAGGRREGFLERRASKETVHRRAPVCSSGKRVRQKEGNNHLLSGIALKRDVLKIVATV